MDRDVNPIIEEGNIEIFGEDPGGSELVERLVEHLIANRIYFDDLGLMAQMTQLVTVLSV